MNSDGHSMDATKGTTELLLSRLLFAACALVVAFMAGACFNRGVDVSEQEPDILATLPTDWRVVNREPVWTRVNVDDDPDTEFLLFYTYNNSSTTAQDGPVGATVYDLQDNTEQPDLREQPAPSYQPYRLLPNFWGESATGFIAPPGSQNEIVVHTFVRAGVTEDTTPSAAADEIAVTEDGQAVVVPMTSSQELVICGGDTTVTFAWWRNLIEGYHVASVHAAAGFDGLGCATLTALPEGFDGLEPLHDRSLLCRRVGYQREPVQDDEAERDIRYVPTQQGIDFCRYAPQEPFYPEAVVMAYLDSLEGGIPETYWVAPSQDQDAERIAGVRQSAMDWFADLGETRLLIGLYGPRTVPFLGTQQQHGATVCAEFLTLSDGRLSAYSFRLRHFLPNHEERVTDRWRITDIAPIPAPPGGPSPDCADIVPNGTPGRALMP